MSEPHHTNPELQSSGDIAVIGEGTPNKTQISLQTLQSIYYELTGKTEELSKSFDEPFQIEAEDLYQLHYKLTQTMEQFNVKGGNLNIKLFYINDTTDSFSSFERFKAFNAGSSSPVESVLFTYNFMVLLPKTNQPQSYTISIRIASRIAIERRMKKEMPFDVPKIFKLMGGRVAQVSIKYVDYTVARNLLNTTDEWFSTLRKSQCSETFKFIKKNSGLLPIISRYFVGAVSFIILVSNMYRFILPYSVETKI
jgi:hypothetical protein